MNLRKHLTYANIVSSLCLFMALGGVAYAGTQLAKGSVGTSQLKAEAVTKGKLAPNSVNSKKVVDGSLTGNDIDASTLGKVPNAANAEHATNANTATNANSATNATTATNAGHATSADSATEADHAATATNAEEFDGKTAEEFGTVLVASAEIEKTFEGELYFSVSGSHEGGILKNATSILPGRAFRATDFAIHLEGSVAINQSVKVSLVVDGTPQEVCTLTEVPGTCTPSAAVVEVPSGKPVAWEISSPTAVTARPEFALRLLPH
jgi:hypothetical protein